MYGNWKQVYKSFSVPPLRRYARKFDAAQLMEEQRKP